MKFLAILYKFYDLPGKIAFRFQILKFKNRVDTDKRSDSELTDYVSEVRLLITNTKKLKRFRSRKKYMMILEHLTYEDGNKYLESIRENGFNCQDYVMVLQKIDSFGKPRKFKYNDIGWVSPTALRYLSIALDIKSHFGPEIREVVEVGVGYGGLLLALAEICTIKNYSIYDLEDVMTLTDRYLENVGCNTNVIKRTIEQDYETEYDLFVSNYAFSELPIHLQGLYMDQVMKKSKNGYVIMNSGDTNLTGRNEGKMKLDEIISNIPTILRLEEKPKTGQDNYLLMWKVTK